MVKVHPVTGDRLQDSRKPVHNGRGVKEEKDQAYTGRYTGDHGKKGQEYGSDSSPSPSGPVFSRRCHIKFDYSTKERRSLITLTGANDKRGKKIPAEISQPGEDVQVFPRGEKRRHYPGD